MVKVFISYKEKANFGGKENVNLVEIWKDSYLHMDGGWTPGDCGMFISTEEIKGLRSGLYVFVYVRVGKGERFTEDMLCDIFKIIYGRSGWCWSFMDEKTIWGVVPKWGKEKIIDKGGVKWDVIRAIRLYAKRLPENKVWEEVNNYRKKRGKPPYSYVGI